MKKSIFTIIALLCFALSACDKVPENGELDGLWQLMEIRDGDRLTVQKKKHIYCSFQLKLFMLGSDHDGMRAYFGRFERTASTLRFHSFTYRSDYSGINQSEDVFLTDEADLHVIAPWGFYSTDCTFDIVRLDGSSLVLRHDDTVITYRKL